MLTIGMGLEATANGCHGGGGGTADDGEAGNGSRERKQRDERPILSITFLNCT